MMEMTDLESVSTLLLISPLRELPGIANQLLLSLKKSLSVGSSCDLHVETSATRSGVSAFKEHVIVPE